MPDLKPCIPLPLDDNVLEDVVAKAKDWAIMHGAAMRSKTDFNPDTLQVHKYLSEICHVGEKTLTALTHFSRNTMFFDVNKWAPCLFLRFVSFSILLITFQFAPFILTPTLFPRREFEKAIRLQPILNELMHWVAHDTEFLRETLANTIQVDEFTGNLFKIYERLLEENGGAQV